VPLVDHVALCPADLAESLRFHRDGTGRLESIELLDRAPRFPVEEPNP
jgi:hypothetical protein